MTNFGVGSSGRVNLMGKLAIAGGALLLLTFVMLLVGGFGYNSADQYQIVQSVSGNVTVRDRAGWYPKYFATVTNYPRAMHEEFTGEGGENPDSDDESIRITFNDGGTAWISTMVRFSNPQTEDMRFKAHRQFSGRVANIADSINAHLINCAKAAGPLMTSTEHHTARKAEYTQIVDDMMRNGLYKMRSVEVNSGNVDAEGMELVTDEIKVYRTEIIKDGDGQPVIAQVSPLKEYGIRVLQFSITQTNYDKKTREKFDAKKDSFLKAEQAKAERQQEIEQRLMVQAKGLRELAEVEAEANKLAMTATVDAERVADVARIEAEQKVVVAEQSKIEAETRASQQVSVALLELEVAKTEALSAEQQASAIKTLASAEQERIKLAGAITERERVLAEIAATRDAKVAEQLAKIKTPSTLIVGSEGSNGGGSGSAVMQHLVNMALMQANGIIPRPNSQNTRLKIGPVENEDNDD